MVVSVCAIVTALGSAMLFASNVTEISADPEVSAEQRRAQALDAYYSGDQERALAEYLEILEQDAADTHARTQIVWLLRELGRHDEALEHVVRLRAVADHEDRKSNERGGGASDGDASDEGASDDDARSTTGDRSRLELTTLHLEVSALAGRLETADTILRAEPEAADAPAQLYLGLAEYLGGDSRRAAEAFDAAREQRGTRPHAERMLGGLASAQGEHHRAVELLQAARREEPNLTATLVPLAEALRAIGETEEAHDVLTRAELSMPWNRAARELKDELVAERPEITTAEVERREKRIADLRSAPADPIAPYRDAIPLVRVGLAENLSRLDLKTGGSFLLRSAEGEILAAGEPETVIRVRSEGENFFLALEPSREPPLDDAEPRPVKPVAVGETVRLEYLAPDHTTAVFQFAFGAGQYSAGHEDRRYRGAMELMPSADGGVTLVNEVNIEEYLYSVVPSEMPSSWPSEALRAQAVAARSYTLAGLGRFAERGFDLFGSVRSAFYRGVEGEHPNAVAAVQATQGEVLMDGSRPLNAVYSANAGGHTESSEIVWGSSTSLVGVADPQTQRWMQGRREAREGEITTDRHGLPLEGEAWLPPAALQEWLRTRPDSFSGDSRFAAYHAYRWRLVVERSEIEARLEAEGEGIGELQAVIPRGRGVGGRVRSVELRGSDGRRVLTGDTIRHRLGGLRSTLFVVDPVYNAEHLPEFFVFHGGGWGHGVGMCQTGAASMGRMGYPYQAILAHYYPRAELSSIYHNSNTESGR